jgi:hypothetical protein
MERFTEAIKQSLLDKNWYAALFMSLTMPDICGNLSYPSKKSDDRYKAWFDEYLSKKYTRVVGGQHQHVFLSAPDCYALRCALLHAGSDDVTGQKAKDVLTRFSFSTRSSHCNQIGSILLLNVSKFCEDIVDAISEWQSRVATDNEIQERIKKLITIHEGPYSPLPGVKVG